MVLDHNGLFARRFPIAFSGFSATDIFGFYQRRFDLLAINSLLSFAVPRTGRTSAVYRLSRITSFRSGSSCVDRATASTGHKLAVSGMSSRAASN